MTPLPRVWASLAFAACLAASAAERKIAVAALRTGQELSLPFDPMPAHETVVRLGGGGVAALIAMTATQSAIILFASAMYAAMVCVHPRVHPQWAAVSAVAGCVLWEILQLSVVPWPGHLSSLLGGWHFSWLDIATYPAGAALASVAHWAVTRRGEPFTLTPL